MQTPTAAVDLQTAVKKALHSASFTKFMGSAIQLALAETREATEGVHLARGFGRFSPEFREGGIALSISGRSGDGQQSYRLQREYLPTHPSLVGVWYGSEYRLDDQGREWGTKLPSHVVDDFGTLVPVTGGAA